MRMVATMGISRNRGSQNSVNEGWVGEVDRSVVLEVGIAACRGAEAIAADVAGLAGAIARWRVRRRAVAEMSRLSNHMLKDIGVARGDIRNLVDGLLDAPKARPAGRPRLVAANPPAHSAPTVAANDNVAGIAA